MKDIGNGKITSLKLFFNRRKKAEFKKTFFRLKIYETKNNLPHNELFSTDLRFDVSTKKEFIELDLKPLELTGDNDLFIGIELLEENQSFTFSIDCNTQKKESNTYYKLKETENWLKIPNIDIRMKIELDCK